MSAAVVLGYPKPFKAQVVLECLHAGASIASVALSRGINANLVRKWIPLYRDSDSKNLPAFIPLKLEPSVHDRPEASIRSIRPAKSSTQPCKAKTWCPLK
jgi:transposase-like protein